MATRRERRLAKQSAQRRAQNARERDGAAIVVVRRRSRIVPVLVVLAIIVAFLVTGFFVLQAQRSPVAVPDIVGLSRTEAASRAAQSGFRVRIVERAADDPAGIVLSQSPGAGSYAFDGNTVTMTISKGAPPVAIPDVAGQASGDAQRALQAAGFVARVEKRFDETVAADIALATDPAAAAQAPRDTVVVVFVSDGPAPVPVPAVVGKTYDEAVRMLSAAKLRATRAEDFSDTVANGLVIRTDPAVGQNAPRDSAVSVVVSKGPELVTVPSVVGLAVEQAAARIQAAGLVADVQNFGPGKSVRAQDPASGKVRKGSKVTLFL